MLWTWSYEIVFSDSVLDVLWFGWGFAGVLKDRIFFEEIFKFCALT
jgi:hypothetical protein